MTVKEFAARIGGRQRGKELTADEKRLAEDSGLVVVYGASDDLMEIDGAVDDEADCFDGETFHINRNGFVRCRDEDGEFCENCPYFKAELASAMEITAVWNSKGDPCWTYKTDIPHEEFAVWDNEEPDTLYCIGIVFSLEDLKKPGDGWISVSEKMPGPFEVVLICVKSRNGYGHEAYLVTIGAYSEKKEKWLEYTAPDSKLADGETVTHWMPLPKPPFAEQDS